MVSTYANLCMPKAAPRVHTAIPPTPIYRTPQHHRPIAPIEGQTLQVMVDQLTGLATNLANLGLTPTTQTSSTFTLPGLQIKCIYELKYIINLIYFQDLWDNWFKLLVHLLEI